eukprot:TRINITY_DN22601_c0_g1_i1.p1 TRINITY_DN22601_c0_g1~~TRINITY_DN22601_c0_g1_i1.p1  ORF type:complete len:100 (-),score=10.97 TRINITY_DN22601_c0_g1_i1:58-357(-)
MSVDSSPLYTHPLVASAAYEHIAHFPPHGPFAHLSALSLIDVLDTHFGVSVSVEEVLGFFKAHYRVCLLYTSDAADEEDSVDLGGRRIIKKKKLKRLDR